MGTHELMDNGKAQYLEVLTAQESLLSAQLNEASNMYGWCSGYHCAVHRPWRGNEVRGEGREA